MNELICEFFNSTSKNRNITIEELLEKYSLNHSQFWNYVYQYDLTKKSGFANRIKNEDQKRKNNRKSIEIYRAFKDDTSTLGDIARTYHLTIHEVIELLQNPYLEKGLTNFSIEKIKEENTRRIQNKANFEMYFYFIEHPVTFEELAEKFQKEEAEIINYFDEFLKSELTEKQIHKLFHLNHLRHLSKNFLEHRTQYNQYFMLTPGEEAKLDDSISLLQTQLQNTSIPLPDCLSGIISGKQNELVSQLQTLSIIKRYLTDPAITLDHLFEEYCKNTTYQYERFQKEWLIKLLGPEIMSKFKIKCLIGNSKVYDYGNIDCILSAYGDWINCPDKTLKEFADEKEIPLHRPNVLDQKSKTKIFSKIYDAILPIQLNRYQNEEHMKLYVYYMQHFILLKDLGPLFSMSDEKVNAYFKSISETINILEIENIDQKRHQKLEENFQMLFQVGNILNQYLQENLTEEAAITQLFQCTHDKLWKIDFTKQKVYIKRIATAAQFTSLYLLHNTYSIDDLKVLFENPTHNTIYGYLYHNKILSLLDPDIVEYMKLKRDISRIIGSQKGRDIYVQNQSYLKLDRNEKGQFIKK